MALRQATLSNIKVGSQLTDIPIFGDSGCVIVITKSYKEQVGFCWKYIYMDGRETNSDIEHGPWKPTNDSLFKQWFIQQQPDVQMSELFTYD